MARPTNFNPQPRPTSDGPLPAPPTVLKQELYTHSQALKYDEHAIMVAYTHYTDFGDLLWDLIISKDFDEMGKARVIFRWMTMKHAHDYTFDSSSTPGSVLQKFRSGECGFAGTFEHMALYAGLQFVTIRGWAKGAFYLPGMQVTSENANHSWNAVHINGNWQLVDCEFATRYYNSEEDVHSQNGDFYFIPNPNEFIYSHFPADTAWQLCHSVGSRIEFDERPSVKPSFFTTGMHFLQQSNGVIHTHNGILVLTLGIKRPAVFSFELTLDSYDRVHGVSLQRYVIHEKIGQRVSFYFRAPRKGTYFLTIGVQKVSKNLILQSPSHSACKFKIICNEAAAEVKPFPPCASRSYGPGINMKLFGLTSSEKKAILQTTNGQLMVIFTKTSPVYILAYLRKDGISDTFLENAILIEEESDQVYIKCDPPSPGEYGLEIHAMGTSDDCDTFSLIGQYLVTCSDQDLQTLYGQVYDGVDPNKLVPYNHDPDTYAALLASISTGGTPQEVDRSTSFEDYSSNEDMNDISVFSSMHMANMFETFSIDSDETADAGPTARPTAGPTAGPATGPAAEPSASTRNTGNTEPLPSREVDRATSSEGYLFDDDMTDDIYLYMHLQDMFETLSTDSEKTADAGPTAGQTAGPTAGPATGSAAEPSATRGTFECTVCLQDDKQIQREGKHLMSTMCGHIFCNVCIHGVLQSREECPLCRNPLTESQVHPLYP